MLMNAGQFERAYMAVHAHNHAAFQAFIAKKYKADKAYMAINLAVFLEYGERGQWLPIDDIAKAIEEFTVADFEGVNA